MTAGKEYTRIFEIGEKAQAEALTALVDATADVINAVNDADHAFKRARSFVLFNSLAFTRTEWVECDLQVGDGEIIVDAASSEQVLPGTPTVDASSDDVWVREDSDSFTLENGELQVVVSKQSGFLDRVWDKRFQRNVLKAGGKPGNTLEISERSCTISTMLGISTKRH